MQAKVAALKDSFSGLDLASRNRWDFPRTRACSGKLAAAGRGGRTIDRWRIWPGAAGRPSRELARCCAVDHAPLRSAVSQHDATKSRASALPMNFSISTRPSDAFERRRLKAAARPAGSRPMSTHSREWALAASRVRPWVASIDIVERADAAGGRQDHRVGRARARTSALRRRSRRRSRGRTPATSSLVGCGGGADRACLQLAGSAAASRGRWTGWRRR